MYLMFLNHKNDEVSIKGCGCANGRNHRNWLSKEETKSPTVSTEGLMLSYVIGMIEAHVVENSDIPGDFLQADYDKVHVDIKRKGQW